MNMVNTIAARPDELNQPGLPPALLNEKPMDSNMNEKIKLMVVDDHPLVRKGITLCLAHSQNIKIIGELDDALLIVSRAQELQPDVVLMDIGLPEMSGLTATRLLLQAMPDVRVLILSIHDDPENVCQALLAGARGYICKDTSAADLARAVEAVYRGESYFSPNVMRVTLDQFLNCDDDAGTALLTDREREVLVLIAEGRSNKDTAAELGISVRTIETHRENLMHKLDIHSAAGLARFAVARGLVSASA